MKYADERPGNIFFIPLFLPGGVKENIKDYSKFQFDPSLDYAFGRLILTDKSAGDLVEIFQYHGSIPDNADMILKSGLLFNPIHVSMGFGKKRWRFVFEDLKYQPAKDSDYNNIAFILGDEDNYILWQGGKKSGITNAESNKYDKWIVYPATKVEDLIKEKRKQG